MRIANPGGGGQTSQCPDSCHALSFLPCMPPDDRVMPQVEIQRIFNQDLRSMQSTTEQSRTSMEVRRWKRTARWLSLLRKAALTFEEPGLVSNMT